MNNIVQVIAPSSKDPLSAEKKVIVKDECERLGWSVVLPADQANTPSFSMAKMLETFASVNLIIADLSYERPSCYFELGCAEALGRPVKVVAEAGTQIHQTSLLDSVRYYKNLDEFRNAMAELLSAPGAG